ncbi:hypothetical protein JK363_00475 [Streptomyces sp. 205]|uniref:DUF3618 domain-containing protein n=2 Tax=Streptomyces coffeae TaxID=621382 RepID=A0ABS1N542_9ACTN|nr:hypothetical protein [Streptomyces coffeae]MBL1095168.1 hypothetical protein [Streptomyces coffeae]
MTEHDDVALELARLHSSVEAGFARLDGRLDLLTQKDDQTDKALADHEQRLAALERARWPLPSLAVIIGGAGCALSAWQLIH